MSRLYPMPKGDAITRKRHAGYIAQQVADLPIGADFEVEIRPARKKRTGRQNNYLHAMLTEIARHTGDSVESTKDDLVGHFDGWREERIGGVLKRRRRSTADMTTKEIATLCDQIHAWAAEFLGLLLPLPEEFREQSDPRARAAA